MHTLSVKLISNYNLYLFFPYSQAGTRTRNGNTEAQMGLEFNNTASQNGAPAPNEVVNTLVEAVSNPNSTFNITIDRNSIETISKYSLACCSSC